MSSDTRSGGATSRTATAGSDERNARQVEDQASVADTQVPPVRLWIGRIAGPLAALATYFLLRGAEDLSTAGRTTAAVGVLLAVWWMTEALPLPATALVPIVAFPLLGVMTTAEATAPYADPNIFLFMGGFMIALAMQRWDLHKRIALLVVRAVGTRPDRLIAGFMLATAFISMWVSNTATTVMMLPIGLSVLLLVLDRVGASADDDTAERIAEVGDQDGASRGGSAVTEMIQDKDTRNFAVALMLGIAYAASIGSLATLIGTPPNLILAGFVEQQYDIELGFGAWMIMGAPLSAVFLVLAWFVLTKVAFRSDLREIPGGKEVIQAEIDKLGRTSRAEWTVLAVFVTTALLWVFRQPITGWEALTAVLPFMAQLSDPVIAIAGALALFLIPVSARHGVSALDWKSAQQLPWGVLLLFGGGLSLASAVQASGLDEFIGTQVSGLGALPILLLIAATTTVVLLLTEITSNTATAAAFLPVLGGVALGLDIAPLVLLVPAALAATCAFMLPVATPPNAIVFGSGYVTVGQMLKAGTILNVVGILLITLAVYGLGGVALGIAF